MKLYKGVFFSLALASLLGACSKENPFGSEEENGAVGMLMTSCLAPSLTNAEGYEAVTRAAIPSTDDFKVVITRAGTRTPAAEYKYADMPEVLTLPVGDYVVSAHHGDNNVAAWEEPYYFGESTFHIEENKITDEVDPIVAKLSNIRVTIVYGPSLVNAMGADSKVSVNVGESGTMSFAADEERSAYFKYVDKSQTLTATFSGTVDGQRVVETKAYDNVAPGNHYRITFRLHTIDQEDPGSINGGITVDASVEQVDMNVTVDGETDEPVEDDMRPVQGGNDTPDPGPGPDQPVAGPTVTPLQMDGKNPIDFDALNLFDDNLYCAFNVASSAAGGFTEFTVDIISNDLTADELAATGLASHLDLINTPDSYAAALQNLGFPINQGGKTSADFDISGFQMMLAIFGPHEHEFKITVSDANGTTVKSLRVVMP